MTLKQSLIEQIRDQVAFSIQVEESDTPIRGNASAIDEVTDREAEEWVLNHLRQGNVWAWADVRVVARWCGFQGDDSLCCVMETSERSFMDSGYYDDMKDAALAELIDNLARSMV